MPKFNEQILEDLVDREKYPVYEISTVFPFTLFPTQIRVFRNKIVIIKNFFLNARYEFSILIDDLKTVTASASLIFASLFFEVKGYEQNPQLVKFLWRDDAFAARKIIMGLVMLKHKKITTENITNDELLKMVKQLG